ncbi:MAG TPA: DeoR/GlpR family DNA-binding transcription regulator [Acetobacteraceae bacterium]|nr:DeoR/GlpR family DNA-binding transcription regulator [Acetobacteraceae bacterium]
MESPGKRVDIIPAKRRAMILEHLRASGAASIQELAEAIGGSPSTIRRDLEHLVETGHLERTHGGALLLPLRATFERETSVNAQLRRAQKLAIGAVAAQRLRPRDSVILESSSTVMEAARAAAPLGLPLTIVTNSLDIAQLSAGVASWRVIMPGGTIRPGSGLLAGEPGESFFKTVHADLCLTGTYAVTGGILTDASLEVAALKRAMVQSARRTILLVDSSKFGPPAFCTFCDLSAIEEVITDDGIRPEHLDALRALPTRVTVVPVEAPPLPVAAGRVA